MKNKVKIINFVLVCLISTLLFGCKKKNDPVRLMLSNPPTVTEYAVGETFNPNGIKLIYEMSDGSMQECESFTYSPTTPLTANTNKVTVSSNGLSLDIAINVKDNGVNKVAKHLIKNKDGSYGGTLNLHKSKKSCQ